MQAASPSHSAAVIFNSAVDVIRNSSHLIALPKKLSFGDEIFKGLRKSLFLIHFKLLDGPTVVLVTLIMFIQGREK